MVVAKNLNYTFHQPTIGSGYDGVVRVEADGYYGTGALLYSGYAVLTAAHVLVDDDGDPVTTVNVNFETANGNTELTTTDFLIHPDYDSIDGNNDLAILFLPQQADVTADRYQLYRQDDEADYRTVLAGYGISGTGLTGADPDSDPHRYKALNTLDVTAGELLVPLGRTFGWSPDPDTILVADFDSWTTINDALGRITDDVDLGTGIYEGLIAPGDSGGPAFIDGAIAGIANYTVSMEGIIDSADVDDEPNSSFGELGFWHRVSSKQQWIDQSLRNNYTDAPQTPAEVIIQVEEGDSLLYFMVNFHGARDTPEEIISIDYTTRNGTAIAGEDYLSVSGTLNLYSDEIYALIPVEVIDDNNIEVDETFYLDISNPQGGTFADGVTTLTAMRTIIDDDGWA